MTPDIERAFREACEAVSGASSDEDKTLGLFVAGAKYGRAVGKAECMKMLQRRVDGAHEDYAMARRLNDNDIAHAQWSVWNAFGQFLHLLRATDFKNMPWEGQDDREHEPHPSPENVKAWLAALRKQGVPYDMACRLISVMNELLGPCEFKGVLPREKQCP